MISYTNKWLLAVLSALLYCTAGFVPFHWTSPFIAYENAAERKLEAGWQFLSPGIVKTISAPDWLSDAIERSSLRVVLEIRSAGNLQSGPARILSISKDPYHQNLIIAQDRTSLVLRLRTPQTNLSGIPGYKIDGIFTHLDWQQIDLLIEPGSLRLHVNGTERLTGTLPARALSVWDASYPLALGNEMTFDRPWSGYIRRAEISVERKNVDYSVGNLLHLPQPYYVIRTSCLVQIIPLSCGVVDRARITDWFLNILGYIPFGFLVARCSEPRTAIRSVVLAAFGVSLSTELGQIFLPGRFSSGEDLVLNVLGAVIGATVQRK